MWKKNLVFSLEKWQTLQQLLESGYSLNEALKFFDVIDAQELDYNRFYDLYIKKHKQAFYKQMQFFYELFPLDQSIKASLEIENFKKKLTSKLLKSTFYPFTLFFISILILYFFAGSILPQLASNFNVESYFYTLIKLMPILLYYLAIIMSILVTILLLLYLIHKDTFYYLLKVILSKSKLFKYIHSYYFLGYFTKLNACGLSSKNNIEYLRQLNSYKLFSDMIEEFNSKLNHGKTLLDCVNETSLLCRECVYTINMAFQTNLQSKFYEQGLVMIENAIEKSIKKMTYFVTIIAYLFVLIIVLVMYQLMLIPLDMIQQI